MAEGFNPINYVGFQDPATALKLQQQQALAAQLMAESAPRTDINTPVGSGPYARVAAYSPLEGLSKGLEKGMGAYLQNQSNEKLANALAGPGPATMGDATNEAITSEGYGPATASDVSSKYQQALANRLSGDGMTPQEKALEAMLPKAGIAQYEQRMKQQNYQNEAAAKAQYDTVTLPGGKIAPKTSFVGPKAAPDLSTFTPPNLQAAVAQQAAPVQQTTASPAAPAAPADGAPANPVILKGGSVDANDPAAVKEAETKAAKTGENAADVGKTLTVMQSNLPMVLDRFEKMRGAAKDASYGFGTTEGEDGMPAVKVAMHDMINGVGFPDKAAEANGIIQQTSAQGVLPELGPMLAQAGIKGNKFLETLSSNASAIPLHQAPDVKMNTINGLETQYVSNLKSTAAQARKYGDRNAPTDAQIDKLVADHKGKLGQPAGAETKQINGVTYTKINGQWHQ
jgi:hypothetical protein